MLKGFKEFISNGSVIDVAIAFIMGAAFKPIVDKLTEVLMAIIGQIIGSPNFDEVGKFSLLPNPTEAADYIYPGTIVTAVINFLLVAVAVYFFMVVPINKMRARKAVEEAPAGPSEAELLGEIRDLLASK